MKQEILRHLPAGHPWANLVQTYDVLPSTNDHAKALARQGAPEGTVVIARQQTAGRGRLGRNFHSPQDGGLYFSAVLRPGCSPGELMHLTCAVAVAACDAVERVTDIRPGIKWINDLTIGTQKLGGILTELSISPGGTVDFAVVGIGINCAAKEFPEELRPIACSIASASGQSPELSTLAGALVVELEKTNRILLSDRETIMGRYRQNCVTLGKAVRVIAPSGVRVGQAQSVEDNGALTVRFSDGHTEAVNSGEVSVRGLWDYL